MHPLRRGAVEQIVARVLAIQVLPAAVGIAIWSSDPDDGSDMSASAAVIFFSLFFLILFSPALAVVLIKTAEPIRRLVASMVFACTDSASVPLAFLVERLRGTEPFWVLLAMSLISFVLVLGVMRAAPDERGPRVDSSGIL